MSPHSGRAAPTPEDLCSLEGDPVDVDLQCRGCGSKAKIQSPWVMVDPSAKEDGWDGIILGRIFTCPSCGAVDEYDVTGRMFVFLIADALKQAVTDGTRTSRVAYGQARLWDGSLFRRPSEGLAHLRALTASQPDNPEAWRRLGNMCERYGLLDEAVTSWHQAFDVGDDEFEAAYSLADYYGAKGGSAAQAAKYLVAAIERLPRDKALDEQSRNGFTLALTSMLFELIDQTDQPLALMAAWDGGQVDDQAVLNLSSVDLRTVQRRERVAEFMARPDVISLSITSELPTDQPTQLQQIIDERSKSEPAAEVSYKSGGRPMPPGPPRTPRALRCKPGSSFVPAPARAARRPGRNAPCRCGSGRKYKKCCLQEDERGAMKRH